MLSWLYFKELCIMKQVNKQFHSISDDPTLWKSLYEWTFSTNLYEKTHSQAIPWKDMFKSEIGKYTLK